VLAAIAPAGLWAGRATATRFGMAGAAAAIDIAGRPRKGQPKLPAVVTANASPWTEPRRHSVNAVPNECRLWQGNLNKDTRMPCSQHPAALLNVELCVNSSGHAACLSCTQLYWHLSSPGSRCMCVHCQLCSAMLHASCNYRNTAGTCVTMKAAG
jgi:hypothetical protein